MTVEQFRAHDSLPILWARELESNETLRIVLSVLEEIAPHHYAIPPDQTGDISETRAAIELGFTRGYSKYADTLRLLAKPKQKSADLGETLYVKEEQPEVT